MRPRITLNTFRKLDRAEEQVIRAMMPKTSDADPAPLDVRGWTNSRKTEKTLTFTLGEVARG